MLLLLLLLWLLRHVSLLLMRGGRRAGARTIGKLSRIIRLLLLLLLLLRFQRRVLMLRGQKHGLCPRLLLLSASRMARNGLML